MHKILVIYSLIFSVFIGISKAQDIKLSPQSSVRVSDIQHKLAKAKEAFEKGELSQVLETLDESSLDLSEDLAQIKLLKSQLISLDSILSVRELEVEQKLLVLDLKAKAYELTSQYALANEAYREKIKILEEIIRTQQ